MALPLIVTLGYMGFQIGSSILSSYKQGLREKELRSVYLKGLQSLTEAKKPIEEMYAARKDIISSQRGTALGQLTATTGYKFRDIGTEFSSILGRSGFAESGIARLMREDKAERLGAQYLYGRGTLLDKFNEQLLSASQEYQDRLSELASARAELETGYVSAGGSLKALESLYR